MKKSILLLLLAMLCGSYLFAATAESVVAITVDGASTYELAEVQSIVFDKSHDQVVAIMNLKDQTSVEGITSILFPKQQDDDDTEEELPTDIEQEEVHLYVFPSPVQSTLYIQGVAEDALVQIYNMAGQCVMQENGTEINVVGFTNGTYLLKVNNKIVKFIKK